MNEKMKNLLLWLVITMVMLTVFGNLNPHHMAAANYPYSEFVGKVHKGEIQKVTIIDQHIQGQTTDGRYFSSYMPMPDPLLMTELMENQVEIKGHERERSLLLQIFIHF